MHNHTPAAGGRENEFIVRFTERMDALLGYARGVARDRYVGEDLLSEAFIATLNAVRRGKGPSPETFDAYMLRAIRNIATRTARNQGRVISIAEPTELEEQLTQHYAPDTAEDTWSVSDIRAAFLALPSRDQQVLYLAEVEGRPHSEIADQLGLRANTVTVIAHRAKATLRSKYLEQAAEQLPGCGAISNTHLAAYAAGTLSTKRTAKAVAHLDECETCQKTVRRLRSYRVPVAIMVGIATVNSDAVTGLTSHTTGHPAASIAHVRKPLSLLSKVGYPTTIAATALLGVAALATVTSSSVGPTGATGNASDRQSQPIAPETTTPVVAAVGAAQDESGHRCYAPIEVLQQTGSAPRLVWDNSAASVATGTSEATWPLTVANIRAEDRAPYTLTLTPSLGTQIAAHHDDCTQVGSSLICVVDGPQLGANSFSLPILVSAAAGVAPRPPTILYSPTE